MKVIELTYIVGIEEVEKFIAEHVEFLDKYYDKGIFLCSGRKNPRTGGVILMSDCNEVDVNALIKEDPFFQNNIAEYNVIDFLPTKFIDGLENYIK